jgi:hypothetical protein
MDYGKILARAFEITLKHRALWLFGVLFALFGGSSGGSFNFPSGGGSSGGRSTGLDFPAMPTISSETWQLITILLGALICLALVWLVLSIILRFVSRGALIGLVQELEENHTAPSVRRGFSIGAENFWRLFGIALAINIPLMLFSIVLLLLAALPIVLALLPLIRAGRTAPTELIATAVAGGVGSLALLCCAVLCLAALNLVIRPFYEFIVRACVINKTGVMDSIRQGYARVRANLGNVAVLYILAIGIGIGFGILMIPITLLLIAVPVGIGFAVYALAQSVTGAIIAGVVLGIPMLIILIFISGLYQTFESTYWTLGYRAVKSSG